MQRVREATVAVENREIARISQGILVFLGIGENDTQKDVRYLVDKVAGLRIFEDDGGKMNRSIQDVSGEIMVVSQFTLYADCRKGRRPSFAGAADLAAAEKLYRDFIGFLREKGMRVVEGIFQARMQVGLVNDGPVTIFLESREKGNEQVPG